MRQSDWWWDTAQHMWRTYFVIRHTQESDLDRSEKYILSVCDYVFSHVPIPDRPVLQDYFTPRRSLDTLFVSQYAKDHGIHAGILWIIIRKANRAVIETIGLLDKKEV